MKGLNLNMATAGMIEDFIKEEKNGEVIWSLGGFVEDKGMYSPLSAIKEFLMYYWGFFGFGSKTEAVNYTVNQLPNQRIEFQSYCN